MLRAFSVIYLFAVVVVGSENSSLNQNIHDMNALMAFLSLAFLCMVFFLCKDKEDYGISALSSSLILFLFYSAFTFYLSFNADLSIYPALKIVSVLLFSIALNYFLKDFKILKNTLLLVFAFSGILATSGILEQFFPFSNIIKWPGVAKSSSIFANPNFYSGYLLIHVPIGVFLYFRSSSAFEKVLLSISWIFILVSLGFARSLGAQLLAGLEIAVIVKYFLANKKFGHAKLVGVAALISVLIYFGLLKLVLEPNLIMPQQEIIGAEIETETVWEESSVGIRTLYWQGAWRIFKDHWLFGSGLWTFVELYPQTGLSRIPAHAHNMYLQTAAETGVIGLGLLIICITVLSTTLFRIFKKGSREVVEINLYIALSLIGLFLHNLIEYNWLTANFIYYFVFLVISVEVLNRETQGYKSGVLMFVNKGLWVKVAPIIMILGAFIIVQYYNYQRIINHNVPMSTSIEEMLANTVKAKQICQQCGGPHYLSGIAHMEMYRLTQVKQNLVLAEQEFNEVLHRNPYSLGTYLMLGKIKSLQGKFEEAKQYFIKSMKDKKYFLPALEEIRVIEKKLETAGP